MIKKIISILILIFVALPTAQGKVKLTYKSQKKKPKWITKIPQEDKNYYFVGIKQNAPTLAEGMEGAMRNGISQVIMAIGYSIAIKSEITSRIEGSKEMSRALDKVRETGKAKIKGRHLKETYYEEYSKDDQRYYDIYCLLKYKKKEIKEERERMNAEQAKNRELAGGYLHEASGLIKEGKTMEAYGKYAISLKILSTQPDSQLYYQSLAGVKKIIGGINARRSKGKKRELGISINYAQGKDKFPVEGLKLKSEFIFGEGEISPFATSGSGGLVSFKIQKAIFKRGLAKVKTAFDTEQFLLPIKDTYLSEDELENIKKIVTEKSVISILKAVDFALKKVCVVIWEKRGRRDRTLEGMIGEKLTNAGMKVGILRTISRGVSYSNFDNPDFYDQLLKEGVEVAVIGQVEGIDNGKIYGLHSVTSAVDLRIIDVKGKEIITTISDSKTTADISFKKGKLKAFKEVVEKISPGLIDAASAQ